MFLEPKLEVRYRKRLQDSYWYTDFNSGKKQKDYTALYRHCVDHQPQRKNLDFVPNFKSSHRAHAQKIFFTSF